MNFKELATARVSVRTSYTYEPSLFLKWKMSRVRNMDFSFSYHTTVPDLVSTLAYRNTIDPLSISVGNPFLGKSTVIRPNIVTIACGCASRSCSD